MRFPPLLTINNFVRVTDEAYAAEELLTTRFTSFGMDVSVIGPWLSASFDNPLFPTGGPIMRLTLVGTPPTRIRTVIDDEHGAVLTIADGAAGQKWEVVSKVEWVPDGETAISWVFCFCRPLAAYRLVSATSCEGAFIAPLDETFSMRANPAEEGHAKIISLPAGDYVVSWSNVPTTPAVTAFHAYAGACVGVGVIGDTPSGELTVTVPPGGTLRLFFASSVAPATSYVHVASPP